MLSSYYDPQGLALDPLGNETSLDFLFDDESKRSYDLTLTVPEDGSLELALVDFSAADFRLNLTVELSFRSRANLRIVSLCRPGETKAYSVNVKHLGKKSYSRTFMNGINLGDGTLRFLGSSYIQNGAHESDTRQEGRITNLSEKSHSECSPALLIKDYDVKASHGAAVGAYNPKELYYLMSRGLSEKESKTLITIGTLQPTIESLKTKELKEKAETALAELFR
jgi:Fe-S cluster assembly protein SufD